MTSICYAEDEKLYGEAIKRLHEMVAKKFHGEVTFEVVKGWRDLAIYVTERPPSVILLDLSLGDSREADTIESMRSVWQKWPPIMVLTGNDYDLDLRRKCLLAGADDFMQKTEANRNPELLGERLYHCFLRNLRDENRA